MLKHILSINPNRWHDAKREAVDIKQAREKDHKWGPMNDRAYMDLLALLDMLPDMIHKMTKRYKALWQLEELPGPIPLKTGQTALQFIIDINGESLAESALLELESQAAELRRKKQYTEDRKTEVGWLGKMLGFDLQITCFRIDNRANLMLDFTPDS